MVRPPASVPPGRADAAASYVHARITGITEDLAARKPGGRNTAIYTAALKVGSTLGAARLTPGVEHAAASWTDQGAEDLLMTAAERNGYVADHSASAARAAIRSGLRNGLRNPRPLPDFSRRHTLPGLVPGGRRTRQDPGTSGGTRSASAGRETAASSHEPDGACAARLPAASSCEASVIGQASASPQGRSVEQEDLAAGQGPQTGLDDWRQAIAQEEREERQREGSRNVARAEPLQVGGAITARYASNARADWRDAVIGKHHQAWQPQITEPDGSRVRPVETIGPQVSA